jgi:signal peptidase I
MSTKLAACSNTEKRANNSANWIIYTGSSMNPAFKNGDMLYIAPYESRKIRCGDVVVFLSPKDDRQVVHRVFSVDSPRIKTCGDKADKADPWVLSPDKILGYVTYVRRGKKQRKVHGALRGQLFGMAVKGINEVKAKMTPPLKPVYGWLCRNGLIRRLLHGILKTKVLSFDRPDGKELQLLLGSHVIGRRYPGYSQWQIKPPFRLLVDEKALRKVELEESRE